MEEEYRTYAHISMVAIQAEMTFGYLVYGEEEIINDGHYERFMNLMMKHYLKEEEEEGIRKFTEEKKRDTNEKLRFFQTGKYH